jgi:AbiU2
MSAVSADLKAFSITALEARKISSGLTTEEAAEYVVDAHELTFKDVRSLRKDVDCWRRVYNKRYRDVRRKVFAHKELSNLADVNALMAKTNVAELKELFKFLRALGLALWAAYHNGVAVNLDVYDMQMSVGERVHQEGHAILKSMLSPAARLAAMMPPGPIPNPK